LVVNVTNSSDGKAPGPGNGRVDAPEGMEGLDGLLMDRFLDSETLGFMAAGSMGGTTFGY